MLGLAIYSAISTAPPSADYATFWGNVREIAFMIYLVTAALGARALGRTGLFSSWGTRLVCAGYLVVALGVAAGFVLREDPDWFFVFGVPGNLLAIIGWAAVGFTGVRGRDLPLWTAVLAGLGGVFAVVFADFGTGALVGLLWLVVARPARATADRATGRPLP